MNKQLDFNPKFPQHNPPKFLYYNQTQNGFYLDNPKEVYFLDEAEGWADYNGCYYQRDGEPAGWVFVKQGQFVRYDINKKYIEIGKNIYYPETIFEEEMQNKGNLQYKDQKSYQKISNQDSKNQLDDQSQNNKNDQPSSTLKEHQQKFQKYVQENNMQLQQIYFQKRNYQFGNDQQTGRLRVRSEDYRRDYRYNQNQNMNEYKSYNKLPKDTYHQKGNQNGRYHNHQYYSNRTFHNFDARIRQNYSSSKPYYNNNRNNEFNYRNYNHNNFKKYNQDDLKGFQQQHNQKQHNQVLNPFIDQPLKQQYQNQNYQYQDKRNDHNQIEYNRQPERIQRQQYNQNYQNNLNANYNRHSDSNLHSNYSDNLNKYKESYNQRQNYNKYSKQNENTSIFQKKNIQKEDNHNQKQQQQYALYKNNSYSQNELNQSAIEPIRNNGCYNEIIQDKQGTFQKRERKSRLNQT